MILQGRIGIVGGLTSTWELSGSPSPEAANGRNRRGASASRALCTGAAWQRMRMGGYFMICSFDILQTLYVFWAFRR